MRTLNLVPILLVALATQASAAGILTVGSNARADVFLDNRLMGSTPLRITDIRGGNHKLTLIDRMTNHSQLFSFNVLRHADTAQRIDATFSPSDPPRLIVEFGTGPTAKRVELHDLKDLKSVEDFDDLQDLSSNFLE